MYFIYVGPILIKIAYFTAKINTKCPHSYQPMAGNMIKCPHSYRLMPGISSERGRVPERDMLSLGVMGMGAGGLRKFFRRRRRRRRRPAAPLDWRRRWIGCAAGLFPLHWRHTACRQEEQWKGREEQWKGREEQWKGHVRVCYDYKSMLGL